MAIFEQNTFQDKTEILDGNEYKACEFRNCILVYAGGEFPRLSQCHFAECNWEFRDAASRTISFMTAIYHGGLGGKDVIEKTFENIRRGG